MKSSRKLIMSFCAGWVLTQTACLAAKTVEPPKVKKDKPQAKSTKAIKEKSLNLVQEIMDMRPFKTLGEFESLLGTKLYEFDTNELHTDQKPNSEIEGAVIFADERQNSPEYADVVKAAMGPIGPIELFFNDNTRITYKDVLSTFGKSFGSKSIFGIPSDRTGLPTKIICYADKDGFCEFEFFTKSPCKLHRVVISDPAQALNTLESNGDARAIYECIEKLRYAQPLTRTKLQALVGLAIYAKRGADYTSPPNPFGLFTRARVKAAAVRNMAPVNDLTLFLNRNCKFTPETLHAIYGNPTEVYTMKHEHADVCERDVYIYKQDDLTLTFKFREVSKDKWQGESICFHSEKLP